MPNVLLTQRCVRSCPYCFARKPMSEGTPEDILSWEDLIYIADLTEASGEKRISLLGGEPLLHPSFTDFLIYLLERGFRVTVFTSGIMPPARLQALADTFSGVGPDRLGFLCNLNEPRFAGKEDVRKVEKFLEVMGPQVCPGFNIYRLDFDLAFLLQSINTFGLRRSVRLGITHPIPGMDNRHIAPGQMDAVIGRLMSFKAAFDRLNVSMGPDCGFPLCRFRDEDIGWLYKMTGGMFGFECGPAIDIGPDMSVWSCFPLSSYHRRSVYEFDSLGEIRRFYQEKLDLIRVEVGGIFEACDDCRFRDAGVCAGGCAAHALAAFEREEHVRLPEIYA